MLIILDVGKLKIRVEDCGDEWRWNEEDFEGVRKLSVFDDSGANGAVG